jgi:hypothetical protein
MELELEGGDDAEVAAAAAQRPEEVRVLVGRRADEAPVGGDQLAGEQVVAGEPVLALEPARAAAEREPGDAGRGDAPSGGGEAVLLGGAVDLRPGGAGADARAPGDGIHLDLVERADVQHEAAVVEAAAGHRVPAGSHAHLEPALAGEGERGDHVVGTLAAGDRERPLLDHRVEQGAGVLVGGVAGLVRIAVEPQAQFRHGIGLGRAHIWPPWSS